MASAARKAPRRALRRWCLSLRKLPLTREAEIAAPTRIVRRWTLPFRARPLLCLPALSLVAGTDARPSRERVDADEDAHVDADLGDQHGRDHPVDAGNLHQERVRRGNKARAARRCAGRAPRCPPRSLRAGGSCMARVHGQEEAVMLLDALVERQDQIGALAAQLAPGEIGYCFGRGLARDHRPKHRAAGDAEDVGSNARQLDVGGLKGAFRSRLRSPPGSP
jgi:hypothetical protein